MTADQIRSLQPALAALLGQFRGCFRTERTFGHWEKYLLGLLADLKRKSIEPIALAAGMAVRTLQEFLSFFVWDHERVSERLQRLVMDEHSCETAIGILDASAHAKQGDKTPGVQHQYCGETGKLDNCVVGQHLFWTDNDPKNPFTCMLASDLYLPEEWAADRERCRAAGIPDDAAGGVRPLAGGDVVRTGQAGDRLRVVRGENVSESDPSLVMLADGDVLPGRPDRAASGGKIRGSLWSRWRRRSTVWRRGSGTGTGTRMLN